jgi:hypothetical protein
MQQTYHFGHLEKELQLFGFPRTGAHFLNYCLSGLFDVVSPPHPYLWHQEAVDRRSELNPDALYALGLREPCTPFQPLRINSMAAGVHGVPVESEYLMLVLIRDPIATAYSRYLVERDRWGGLEKLSAEFLRGQLLSYVDFYDKAFAVLARQGDRGMLMRWEELVAGPWPLERLVSFVGLVPKLRCSYVWSVTRFENFVKPGNRTFYRSGKNDAWKIDPEWVQLLPQMKDFSFERFGYRPMVDYLRALQPEPLTDSRAIEDCQPAPATASNR